MNVLSREDCVAQYQSDNATWWCGTLSYYTWYQVGTHRALPFGLRPAVALYLLYHQVGKVPGTGIASSWDISTVPVYRYP